MINLEYNKIISKSLIALLITASLFMFSKFLSEWRNYSSSGNVNANVITVSGHGEVQAVPDIANISFSIRQEAKTVKEAQEKVATIEKSALDFLKTNNIEEKDIKTENASFYPKYEYKYDAKLVPCNEYGCPPSRGTNVIVGYEASETISVKVRNTDDVGKIMQGLGELAVSDLNGPNFTIDDEEALQIEARKKAIENAKEKAKILAKDLGVSLRGVVSFSESDGYYPYPMMYAKDAMETSVGNAPATIPKGENTISSDVTITYEIR